MKRHQNVRSQGYKGRKVVLYCRACVGLHVATTAHLSRSYSTRPRPPRRPSASRALSWQCELLPPTSAIPVRRPLYRYNALQCIIPIYTMHLLVTAAAGVGGVSSELQADELSDVASQLRTMRQLIARLTALNVDPTEYACLKAIVLFKPGNDRTPSLRFSK